jgi:hypothetical protein
MRGLSTASCRRHLGRHRLAQAILRSDVDFSLLPRLVARLVRGDFHLKQVTHRRHKQFTRFHNHLAAGDVRYLHIMIGNMLLGYFHFHDGKMALKCEQAIRWLLRFRVLA